MANFSERMGLVKKVLQKDSMDESLKNALWNAAFLVFLNTADRYNDVGRGLLKRLWANHFHQPADELPAPSYLAITRIKERYIASSWASVYDFVEFIAQLQVLRSYHDDYISACNFGHLYT